MRVARIFWISSAVFFACHGQPGGDGGSADENGGSGGNTESGGNGDSTRSGGNNGGGNSGGNNDGGNSQAAGGSAGSTAGAGGVAGSNGVGGSGGTGGSNGVGGATGGHNIDAGIPDTAPPTADAANLGSPVFVTVGGTGRRIRSLDLGKTWVDEAPVPGGDAINNLAWGNGVFIAGTHTPGKIYYSKDGKTWGVGQGAVNVWVGGVAWGNGMFAGVGGCGYGWYSRDAMTWTRSPTYRGTNCEEAARSLAFGQGVFTVATDAGNWWMSSDGITWTQTTGGHTPNVVFCGSAFTDRKNCSMPQGRGNSAAFGENVWVAVVNGNVNGAGGVIERSENGGQTWQRIAGAGQNLDAVAFGYVP